MTLRVLALEPYYGGSHRAFLDDWISRSRHQWTLQTLPPYKWKWRMRHAPLTFAADVQQRLDHGEAWDVIFCSDMLSLAEFRGLTPAIAAVPAVVYFHENQLTYPVRKEDPRDGHYGFTNIATAIAADEIWFNSAFHRDEFHAAAASLLKRMPDFAPLAQLQQSRSRCHVMPPGITPATKFQPRRPGPLRIVWAARWEHDKNAADFFAAIELLEQTGAPFELSVIGESFSHTPPDFAAAQQQFAGHIVHWGYQKSRADYLQVLTEADVAVSTANHEFFGISIIEAIAAGAVPLLPRRLAYPETAATTGPQDPWFYDGSPQHLARRLAHLAANPSILLPDYQQRMADIAARYDWGVLAGTYDTALANTAASGRRGV